MHDTWGTRRSPKHGHSSHTYTVKLKKTWNTHWSRDERKKNAEYRTAPQQHKRTYIQRNCLKTFETGTKRTTQSSYVLDTCMFNYIIYHTYVCSVYVFMESLNNKNFTNWKRRSKKKSLNLCIYICNCVFEVVMYGVFGQSTPILNFCLFICDSAVAGFSIELANFIWIDNLKEIDVPHSVCILLWRHSKVAVESFPNGLICQCINNHDLMRSISN